MKARPVMRGRREKGQAVVLVILATGILLVGALGLAIDGAQMFAQRQMAQTVADAAAQAGMMSIFTGTNSTEANPFATTGTPPAQFTCATPTDGRTPCAYAQLNGFNTSSDSVVVDFPTTVAGVPPCCPSPPALTLSSDPVNLIRVTATRTLSTGLIRFLGPATSTIKATATAAILESQGPTPVVATHPTLPAMFSTDGLQSITVCGGPAKSIQINSSNPNPVALNGGATVDLSHAGPGTCATGTGGDFGVFGGPPNNPGQIHLGTSGHIVVPAAPMQDPLSNVTPPPVPATLGTKVPLGNGSNGCAAANCQLYSPGLWPSGITVSSETAVFSPGIYYISGSTGFTDSAGAPIQMATGLTDPGTGWTGNVLFYNTGTGKFNLGNSNTTLVGSPVGSAYNGILFFEDRNAAANTGANAHNIGGAGVVNLTGTIYLTNTLAIMKANSLQYQALTLGGSNTVTVNGDVIASQIMLNATANININLDAAMLYRIRQVALVN